ncbi:DUF3021 family protein [Periweissella fabalis]|uniref:DUF3021 domain-containing protein n=1 Tax=Periweissella fabalis TaxID=1070421 RepID=A0A7X6N3P4_9LACO|nr:DUF3021 family protein [Periweissella fabalis]MCM0598117.1 DUF3021 family protein [Periweissella fabalis]NKZ24759.1 DUF3021 domain-containing protein [Periweissella fabalis]
MKIRKYVRHALLGLIMSAAFTMIGALLEWQTLIVTPKEIIGIFLLGIIVGELALILELDLGTFTLRLLTHMILTFCVVLVFDGIFKSLNFIFMHPIIFVFEFLLIYVIVWIVVRLSTKNDIELINEQLANKHQVK